MFTGIITHNAFVSSITEDGMFTFKTTLNLNNTPIGASIACNGICLTIVKKGEDTFTAHVSPETFAKTTIKTWQINQKINIEQPLKMGDELGGHMVSGHVDDVAEIVKIAPDGHNKVFAFKVKDQFKNLIAPKGSVTLDGVSLTVNNVNDNVFDVNVIPHTQQITTFASLQVGNFVNLEIDMFARYVAKLIDARLEQIKN